MIYIHYSIELFIKYLVNKANKANMTNINAKILTSVKIDDINECVKKSFTDYILMNQPRDNMSDIFVNDKKTKKHKIISECVWCKRQYSNIQKLHKVAHITGDKTYSDTYGRSYKPCSSSPQNYSDLCKNFLLLKKRTFADMEACDILSNMKMNDSDKNSENNNASKMQKINMQNEPNISNEPNKLDKPNEPNEPNEPNRPNNSNGPNETDIHNEVDILNKLDVFNESVESIECDMHDENIAIKFDNTQ